MKLSQTRVIFFLVLVSSFFPGPLFSGPLEFLRSKKSEPTQLNRAVKLPPPAPASSNQGELDAYVVGVFVTTRDEPSCNVFFKTDDGKRFQGMIRQESTLGGNNDDTACSLLGLAMSEQYLVRVHFERVFPGNWSPDYPATGRVTSFTFYHSLEGGEYEKLPQAW